jgi:hypothetical protein
VAIFRERLHLHAVTRSQVVYRFTMLEALLVAAQKLMAGIRDGSDTRLS